MATKKSQSPKSKSLIVSDLNNSLSSRSIEKVAKTQKELELELSRDKLIKGLPHIYCRKFYPWQRDFFDSQKKIHLLVAPNQCGKSSIMIRKAIHWATATHLWPKLWPSQPRIFWYLYPTAELTNIEVTKKWIPEFLPQGEYKDSPQYGWHIEYGRSQKEIIAIHFNSGVSIYFKSYAQNVTALQATTVWAMFADEELPVELFPELKFRLTATDGYYHAGFTATLSQPFWEQALKGSGEKEIFPNAWKRQISLYDCQHYEDGTPSMWSNERIQQEIDSCPTDKEVRRRIFGEFVRSEGLRYPNFERLKNVNKVTSPPPNDWYLYAGVDIGSGAPPYGHPSAITFVAVRPDFKFARVFRHWNGKNQLTTASDVFQIFIQMKENLRFVGQYYDFACKDFHTIASRNGESFMPADKSRDAGDQAINSLFKNSMLSIDDIDETFQLIYELEALHQKEVKSKAADDSVDSLRYAIMGVPMDWSNLSPVREVMVKREPTETELRRQEMSVYNEVFDDEISEWQEHYEIY